MSDFREYALSHSKWLMSSEPHDPEFVAKFEGTPADRVEEMLDAGIALPERLQFSDNYCDIEVVYEHKISRWSWEARSWSYTFSEESSGRHDNAEWRKWCATWREKNASKA